MADHHDDHYPTPPQRLLRMLSLERRDMFVLLVYTIAVVLLLLTVPLATQALVNTVMMGMAPQQLVVLTGLVFGGLLLAGGMQILQLSLVELLQQRVFAQTSLQVADRLVRARTDAFRGEYAPELVNRFFDVLTIQKSLSKLLVDGFTASCQAVLGLVILYFYGEVLFLVDLLLVVGFVISVFVMGYRGLRTSIEESKRKYSVVDWLEDIARCHRSLKIHGDREFLAQRADELTASYVISRRSHFAVTLRQNAGYYLFLAVASAAILSAGGWAVLNGSLTLGQLVATQLILGTVFAAMEKLVRQTDKFFDLLTGLDKVGHVTDLPQERSGGRLLPEKPVGSGARVDIHNLGFSYNTSAPVLSGLTLSLKEGERVSLVGASGAGKTTLASLIAGLDEPKTGCVDVDGIEVRDVDVDSLRSNLGVAEFDMHVFDGTVEENITVGRAYVNHDDIRWAVELVQLAQDLAALPEGLKTRVVSGGSNLSRGQIQRILIARAIVGRPRLLILDEAFTGIDERITIEILDGIFDESLGWTILNISHEPEVILRTPTVHVLAAGRIQESGTPEALAANPDSEFSRLFPYLSRTMRNEAKRTSDAERNPTQEESN